MFTGKVHVALWAGDIGVYSLELAGREDGGFAIGEIVFEPALGGASDIIFANMVAVDRGQTI